jgi:OmpA-OmpF porin, OOP family
MNHRNIFPLSCTLLGIAVLAGCSTSSSPPQAPQSPPSFTQALAANYADLAKNLAQREHDAADADYFTRKGVAAGQGQVVVPEQTSNWQMPSDMPSETRDQLADGRRRLLAVLDAGARDSKPELAARAQQHYDCWVGHMAHDWRRAIDGPCHDDFLTALADLEGKTAALPLAAPPPAARRQYNVYFDFDKSVLAPDARKIVARVAEEVKRDSSPVAITGKADLSGTDTHNMALSHRRADAVRQALRAAGVPADRIEEHWVGMREPPVPTARGVREPRNRVVEISFR